MIICDTHCDTLYMRALQPQKTPCVTMEAMEKGRHEPANLHAVRGQRGHGGAPV